MSKPAVPAALTAIESIEEGIALLRRAPAFTVLALFIGSVPFWLLLLYFVADMSHSAYAGERLGEASLALAALFLWMKCWQTVFAANLHALLLPEQAQPWTVRRIGRLILEQGNVQLWGLFVRPLALLVTLPAGWVIAFYQSATVLGDGREPRERRLPEEAWEQARLWPGQNHALLSILFAFSLIVWLNVGVLLGVLPMLLKSLLGWQTMASRSMGTYLNGTFFTVTIAVACLCVDPIWRATFVVRCFHGEAIHSGADIRAMLRAVRSKAVLVLVLAVFCSAPSGQAAPVTTDSPASAVDAGDLSRSIEQVLNRREFAWRLPRPVAQAKKGVVGSWLESVQRAAKRMWDRCWNGLRKLFRWIFGGRSMEGDGSHFEMPPMDTVIWIAGAIVVTLLGWVAWRSWRTPRRQLAVAEAVQLEPDLHSEDIRADQLPEDGWLQLARDLVARGELRLALRAAYLAGLAHLGQSELISIARHKSNLDYQRELRRRARTRDELLAVFDENLTVFERAWYGRHDVTAANFERFTQNLERMHAC